MNNAVFGKMVENVRKHRDITRLTTERRKNYLASEWSYHTTRFFTENLLAIKMRKTEIIMNKLVYLGFSILELNKTLMYVLWYDYVKPKYGEKAKLYYMGTDSFSVYIKTIDIYEDIAKRCWIKVWYNYKLNKPLPKGKNKKVIRLIKDELGEKIMVKFVRLRAKTNS